MRPIIEGCVNLERNDLQEFLSWAPGVEKVSVIALALHRAPGELDKFSNAWAIAVKEMYWEHVSMYSERTWALLMWRSSDPAESVRTAKRILDAKMRDFQSTPSSAFQYVPSPRFPPSTLQKVVIAEPAEGEAKHRQRYREAAQYC